MCTVLSRVSSINFCLILAASYTSLGCTPDEAPDLEQSETSGELVEALPGGVACEANWFAYDGPPVPAELEPIDSLATHEGEIAFNSAPPVRAPYTQEPPVDPSFARMEFETFAATYAEPARSGGWFVEGDHGMSDARLRALHASLAERARDEAGMRPRLAQWSSDDIDAAWSAGEKLALTWCLGEINSSPVHDAEEQAERIALAIAAMEWATREWERAADVNFIHLREFDDPTEKNSGACKPGQNGIDLRVRTGPECTMPCGGRTFAPATPQEEFTDPEQLDGKPEIVLGLQRFFWSEQEARINALHELGHVLGFTHEHRRWEQTPGTCEASLPWRGLTPRDPDSVMGVDSCMGINDNQPRLSAWDRLGAYYAYTWGRRRAQLMGAVSSVDEYAYEGGRRAGIAWQRTRSPELELWTASGGPGEVIDFASRTVCADGSAPPCVGAFDVEGRTRPINAHLSGNATDLDLLFSGPGPTLADLLLMNDAGAFAPLDLQLDGFTIPVVGSFGADNSDQVLLYRPGPEEDGLLAFDEGGGSLTSVNFTGYAYPLAAPYRGLAGGGKSDIVWYEPREARFTVWAWTGNEQFGFQANGPGELTDFALEADAAYVPLVGDFNGDESADIFWYAAGEPTDIMWWSISNQDAVNFIAAQTSLDGDYRPFVGDFDGNGVSDILWFASYAEVAQTSSKIWYFDEDESFTARTLSTNGDYSPYVADFDGDGCSDILWHQPHDSERRALLWRCQPGQREFDCDPPTVTPEHGYPIGFGGAY